MHTSRVKNSDLGGKQTCAQSKCLPFFVTLSWQAEPGFLVSKYEWLSWSCLPGIALTCSEDSLCYPDQSWLAIVLKDSLEGYWVLYSRKQRGLVPYGSLAQSLVDSGCPQSIRSLKSMGGAGTFHLWSSFLSRHIRCLKLLFMASPG